MSNTSITGADLVNLLQKLPTKTHHAPVIVDLGDKRPEVVEVSDGDKCVVLKCAPPDPKQLVSVIINNAAKAVMSEHTSSWKAGHEPREIGEDRWVIKVEREVYDAVMSQLTFSEAILMLNRRMK